MMDSSLITAQTSLPELVPSMDHVLRLAFAIGLGGLIGLERELRDKPAGFRTIILICLGACIFTIVSEVVGGRESESTRIAAQIASGIGFIGAGAIIQNRQSIVGLTTAATVWAAAAVGMACGFGQLSLAVAATVFILVALFLFDSIERFIGDRRDVQDFQVVTANTDNAYHRIISMVESGNLRVRKQTCFEDDKGNLVVQVMAIGAKADHESLRLRFVTSSEYRLCRP